jgi:hypothetical protein
MVALIPMKHKQPEETFWSSLKTTKAMERGLNNGPKHYCTVKRSGGLVMPMSSVLCIR